MFTRQTFRLVIFLSKVKDHKYDGKPALKDKIQYAGLKGSLRNILLREPEAKKITIKNLKERKKSGFSDACGWFDLTPALCMARKDVTNLRED